MELCLYNAVLTSMSNDGTKFTYTNQLASSAKDLSERQEWFECACCPPNVTRLMGDLGGYLWDFDEHPQKLQNIRVHQYTDAKLSFPLTGGGGEKGSLRQETRWPWDGEVKFTLETGGVDGLDVAIYLRIPSWGSGWKVSIFHSIPTSFVLMNDLVILQIIPSPPSLALHKGYLTLSPTYLAENPTFQLSVPFIPRTISPHPYTHQNVISIARGPLIYCVEDFDNPWVDDHFKVCNFQECQT